MKRKIVALLLGLTLAISTLTGCGNKDVWDTVYTFDYAIIKLPNGEVVEGKVQSWCDYEGEQLQVKINGETYLTCTQSCTLIADYKGLEPGVPISSKTTFKNAE